MLQVRQKALGRDIEIPPTSWSPPCRPGLAATLIAMTPAQLSEKKFGLKVFFFPFCRRDEAFLQPCPRTRARTKCCAKEIQAQGSVLGLLLDKKCGCDSSLGKIPPSLSGKCRLEVNLLWQLHPQSQHDL